MPDIREVTQRLKNEIAVFRAMFAPTTDRRFADDIGVVCDFTEAAVALFEDSLTGYYIYSVPNTEGMCDLLGLDEERVEAEYELAIQEYGRPMELSRCRKESPCQTSEK